MCDEMDKLDVVRNSGKDMGNDDNDRVQECS